MWNAAFPTKAENGVLISPALPAFHFPIGKRQITPLWNLGAAVQSLRDPGLSNLVQRFAV